MSAKRPKTARVNIRFDPAFKAALEEAAEADLRSVASLIEKVMTDYLKTKGYLTALPTSGKKQPTESLLDAIAGVMEHPGKQAEETQAATPALPPDTCAKQQPTSQSPSERPLSSDRLADRLFGIMSMVPGAKAYK